jgi:hypothetical protein
LACQLPPAVEDAMQSKVMAGKNGMSQKKSTVSHSICCARNKQAPQAGQGGHVHTSQAHQCRATAEPMRLMEAAAAAGDVESLLVLQMLKELSRARWRWEVANLTITNAA